MFDQIFGQVFDQIADQGFDQCLGREQKHKCSVQYYPALGKNVQKQKQNVKPL